MHPGCFLSPICNLYLESYHIKPIYILQKKVDKAVAFMNFDSPSPIFSDLKILKLCDLFHLKLLLLVYECVNWISPSVFNSFFEILSDVH